MIYIHIYTRCPIVTFCDLPVPRAVMLFRAINLVIRARKVELAGGSTRRSVCRINSRDVTRNVKRDFSQLGINIYTIIDINTRAII